MCPISIEPSDWAPKFLRNQVDHSIVLLIAPAFENRVPVVTLNVGHELFGTDLPIADATRSGPQWEHISTLVVSIYVTEGFTSTVNANDNLPASLLIVPWAWLFLEALFAVNEKWEIILCVWVEFGADVPCMSRYSGSVIYRWLIFFHCNWLDEVSIFSVLIWFC